MSVINAILEPNADGTLHLPVPRELRGGKIRIEARLEAAGRESSQPKFGCLSGKIKLRPDFDEPLEDFREYME